jgi:tetratricopeptide (TPR) repeat protein
VISRLWRDGVASGSASGSVEDPAATADGDAEPAADRLLRSELGNLRVAWQIVRTTDRYDDAVQVVSDLTDLAGWRDLTDIWSWALDLAEDERTFDHPRAAWILAQGAPSAWTRGELDRAENLALRGLEHGGPDAGSCRAALALVCLSTGRLEEASDLSTSAADDDPRPEQLLGFAALASAYRGRLDEARELCTAIGSPARSPTGRALQAYVAGEIAVLADLDRQAEGHYAEAIEQSRQSGATFVEGIASVGLLTLRSRAGHIRHALAGYLELIDYWERTGGWSQQWTTLRNLAALLRSLGDQEAALFLESAAESAPEAPAVTSDAQAAPTEVSGTRSVEIQRAAARSSPSEVLRQARRDIDRHLALSVSR